MCGMARAKRSLPSIFSENVLWTTSKNEQKSYWRNLNEGCPKMKFSIVRGRRCLSLLVYFSSRSKTSPETWMRPIQPLVKLQTVSTTSAKAKMENYLFVTFAWTHSPALARMHTHTRARPDVRTLSNVFVKLLCGVFFLCFFFWFALCDCLLHFGVFELRNEMKWNEWRRRKKTKTKKSMSNERGENTLLGTCTQCVQLNERDRDSGDDVHRF